MPAQLLAGAVAMLPDPAPQLRHLARELLARQPFQVIVEGHSNCPQYGHDPPVATASALAVREAAAEDAGMRNLFWFVPIAVFLLNPSFACSGDEPTFQYGAAEMRAAVEGDWSFAITPTGGTATQVTVHIDQAAAPATAAARASGVALVRAAHACGTRTLVKSAGACSRCHRDAAGRRLRQRRRGVRDRHAVGGVQGLRVDVRTRRFSS